MDGAEWGSTHDSVGDQEASNVGNHNGTGVEPKLASSIGEFCVDSLSDVKKRYVKFRFHDVLVCDLKIDSGAEANVIPVKVYRRLFPRSFGEDGLPMSKFIRSSTRRLEAYGGSSVPHLGTVNLPCAYSGKKCRFFLCDIGGAMLLGLPTCEANLGIMIRKPAITRSSTNEMSSWTPHNGRSSGSKDLTLAGHTYPLIFCRTSASVSL